jgi:hypothetical protein
MLQYKGYMISGCSVPVYMQDCQWRGRFCKVGGTGSVMGAVFKTTKEAEAHGLELRESGWTEKTAWRI